MPTSFDTLLETMQRLRDPIEGCPWDLEQSHASLRDTLVEETYEALDALESGDAAQLVEELGDLLLQIVFHAQIGTDRGTFTIEEVVTGLNAKLIRRHPHVFGDAAAHTTTEVTGQWERLKAKERLDNDQADRSMLAGVSKVMPALAYAHAVLGKVRRAGFDWDDPNMSIEKITEEIEELREAETAVRREEEFGDLLFAMVGAAHRLGINGEEALRGANKRFCERFEWVEQAVRDEGTTLADMPTERKLDLWEQAKNN